MSGLELDGLLSVPEAAELLRVSEACIRAWLSKGRLPRVKAGRRTLVARASLVALLQVTQPVHGGVGDGAATHS
ncbi:MAG TPA: helix-turn-helix domain-containing protein [Acidobacteriaceae bacterium]